MSRNIGAILGALIASAFMSQRVNAEIIHTSAMPNGSGSLFNPGFNIDFGSGLNIYAIEYARRHNRRAKMFKRYGKEFRNLHSR